MHKQWISLCMSANAIARKFSAVTQQVLVFCDKYKEYEALKGLTVKNADHLVNWNPNLRRKKNNLFL